MSNNWLYTNLQKWTPFSVIAVIIAASSMFIITWDGINNIAVPAFVYGLVTVILGGTGTATMFSHGVTVANGVAKDTAKAMVGEMNNAKQPDTTNSPKS